MLKIYSGASTGNHEKCIFILFKPFSKWFLRDKLMLKICSAASTGKHEKHIFILFKPFSKMVSKRKVDVKN